MAWDWDLSYLYKGFDDPAFADDLARLPGLTDAMKQAVEATLAPKEKLEALVSADDTLSAVLDRLASFCQLTMSVDATNEKAAQYMDKILLVYNDFSLLESAFSRYVGALDNLDEVVASSPKLSEIGFALRWMAHMSRHMMSEAIEPWMLKMQLSGGNAFSQLRDKLDGTHLVSYRGQELPLAAVRGMAYDADPAVRKDAYEAELASYRKMELPMSFCLNAIKMEARTLAEAQGYESVLDMTLQQSRMDRQTLDAMWRAIVE